MKTTFFFILALFSFSALSQEARPKHLKKAVIKALGDEVDTVFLWRDERELEQAMYDLSKLWDKEKMYEVEITYKNQDRILCRGLYVIKESMFYLECPQTEWKRKNISIRLQ